MTFVKSIFPSVLRSLRVCCYTLVVAYMKYLSRPLQVVSSRKETSFLTYVENIGS